MNWNKLILIAVGAIVLFFVGYFVLLVSWEKVEVEVGLSAEANQNPLLAATLFLKQHNVSITKLGIAKEFYRNQTVTLEQYSTLIVDEAAFDEYDSLEDALFDWVNNGGHLVYLLSPRRDALKLNSTQFIDEFELYIESDSSYMYRYRVLSKPIVNLKIAKGDSFIEANIPYRYYYDNCGGDAYVKINPQREKDEEIISKTLICRSTYGSGKVTFLPSIHAISNAGLKHLDHGEFLLWLVGDSSSLYYLPSLRSPNWLLEIWQWSWIIVMLGVLVMIFGVWHLSMRFGLARTPFSDSKSLFADHLEAVGSFMINNQHGDKLKAALILEIEQVIEKQNPKYKHLELSEKAKLIGQLTGKESAAIEELFSQPLPEDEGARLQNIKLFKELRKLL